MNSAINKFYLKFFISEQTKIGNIYFKKKSRI
jgi:hypothetical protein